MLTLTVTGICENYLRHFVFTDLPTLPTGGENTALLRLRADTDPAALGASLRAEKGVSYVSETQQERETMENSMRSMDLLIALIVVCSGALAFITLYNLTNINLMERTREIATVKVLGFFPKRDGILRPARERDALRPRRGAGARPRQGAARDHHPRARGGVYELFQSRLAVELRSGLCRDDRLSRC